MSLRKTVQGDARARSVRLAILFSALAAAVSHAQVNAPVAPDAIYVARGFPNAGVSVIDLNGFGQSTGDPSFDFTYTTFPEGWSRFPNNPNLIQWGSNLYPPLFPGVTTQDGGSAGVFTLTRDAALDDRLIEAPTVLAPGDMMLGAPLDRLFNNGKNPSGCIFGGGNFCAITGKQELSVTMGGPHTLRPTVAGEIPLNLVYGGGNPISFAPHPNPPPRINPPLCGEPLLQSAEPSSVWNTLPPAAGGSPFGPLFNLLVPGNPLGNPGAGIPPSGLLSSEQNAFFVGPDRVTNVSPATCASYMIRQQLGHFLYVIDNDRDEVRVFNSNTFEMLARIVVPDPTELAMSPNLDLLAVSCSAVDQVNFIDIDPSSATFHTIVDSTPVGDQPRGIAWDPGNEDILVCNEGSNSVSIISSFTRNVRKTLTTGFRKPFGVAITQRQTNFGYLRGVYFAYILDRGGRVFLFESGPSGVNGWGYDSVIGRTGPIFQRPQAIQPDHRRLGSGVWIAHYGEIAPNGVPSGVPGGAVTNLTIASGVTGIQPLTALNFWKPQLRNMSLEITASIGGVQLTGMPTDIAFDNQRNLGALRNVASSFAAAAPVALNGKSQVRVVGTNVLNTNEPRYMFVAVRDQSGGTAIDVLDLVTQQRVDVNTYHAGIQSIPASGAHLVADYFRQ